jgi:hypothetical protein
MILLYLNFLEESGRREVIFRHEQSFKDLGYLEKGCDDFRCSCKGGHRERRCSTGLPRIQKEKTEEVIDNLPHLSKTDISKQRRARYMGRFLNQNHGQP